MMLTDLPKNKALFDRYCQAHGIPAISEITWKFAGDRFKIHHVLYWRLRSQGLDNVATERKCDTILAKLGLTDHALTH